MWPEAPPAELPQAIGSRRLPSPVRAIFSFPVVLAALLVVLTVVTIRQRLNDPDMWWHLKAGELIWSTHSISRADTFSFTAAGRPWVAQEWLSQATIYAAYKLGGYAGLMLWLCLLASLIVLAGYLFSGLYSGNLKVAFLGGFIIWLFATVGFSIRPHLIGYLLLLCELLVLQLGRARDARWFFALPALFALWINCHSSFMFGLAVLGIALFCSFVEIKCGLLISCRAEPSVRRALLVASILSLAALFLNPIGPKLIWYPLNVIFNQPVNLGIVTEWQQPDFDSLRGISLLAVAALILILPLLRRVQLRLDELLLMLLTLYFAARHERMEFIFGILAAPILCRLLATAWDNYDPDRDSVLINAAVLALAAIAIVLSLPTSRHLREQVNSANPVKALEFLNRSRISGRMLNDYVYGGYLIWAAPERKVFVDGRADLYEPTGVLADYAALTLLRVNPKSILDKYRIDFCLLAQDEPIARILSLIPGWKEVYADKQSVVFARKS